MKQTTTDYPPGTVIIPCGELGRYSSFTNCYRHLRVPSGTHEVMKPGLNIARNLNKAMEERIGEWVWFMGDDHASRLPEMYRRITVHERRGRVDALRGV